MSMISVRSAALLVALVAIPLAARADWPAGGMLMSSPGDINGARNARIMELPSGDLCILGVGNGGNSNDYVIQRISRDGVIAPGWPASGKAFSSVLKGIRLPLHSFVVDDAARTWHSWATSSNFLQSIGGDATSSPAGSPFNLGSSSGGPSHAAPAPGGDAFVTCGSARIKRITSAGVPAAGWTSTGRSLPGESFDDNAVLADGSGGVVVFVRELAGGGPPAVTRFDGSGSLHAGWPPSGAALSGVAPFADIAYDSQLLSAGADHMLAVWSLDAGSGMRRLIMQRFGIGDGTLDPAWPTDGLEVVAADTLVACRAIADGSGGAYVVRQSHGHPLATHISATGTVLASDVEFVDAGAHYIPTTVFAVNPGLPDDMIADVTPDGGLLVGWNDTRLAPAVTFRLRWLTGALTPAPGKPDTGLVYFPASPHPQPGELLTLHADGPDAAFIAWSDYHDIGFDQFFGDVWMTRVQVPAVEGITPHPGALSRLALSAPRPNPARGAVAFDVTLPDDSPARVELLDIAGRVQLTSVVQGAGVRAASFNNLGTLAPGLYFARVSHALGSATTRVVLIR